MQTGQCCLHFGCCHPWLRRSCPWGHLLLTSALLPLDSSHRDVVKHRSPHTTFLKSLTVHVLGTPGDLDLIISSSWPVSIPLLLSLSSLNLALSVFLPQGLCMSFVFYRKQNHTLPVPFLDVICFFLHRCHRNVILLEIHVPVSQTS